MKRKCRFCRGVYEVYPSQIRHRGSSYCSMACQRAARQPKTRTCAHCRASFVPPNPGKLGAGKFCSHRCHEAHKHATNPRRFTFACQQCGAEFTRFAAQVKRFGKPKYCSRPCKDAARVRPESEHSRGPGWRRLCETIRERDGRRCVRCGAAEEGRRHAVDHIIPWVLVKSDPALANDPKNLATLCLRCHGIKTTIVEPRLMKGDLLAVREFYGPEIMAAAGQTWNAVAA